MDDQYNFDLNLDFLIDEGDNTEQNAPVNPANDQDEHLMSIESIANKISFLDDLVIQFKALKEEHAKLQQRTRELNDSAMSIQCMYEKEKAERERNTLLCKDLEQRCSAAEGQLANKTLLLEQVSSQVKQSTEKGPISYNDLALRYQRLALQLDEDKQLNTKERTSLQQMQEYIQAKKLLALPAYKKKLPAKKQVREIATQCSSIETKTQSTQCMEISMKPTASGNTLSKGTQCSQEAKSISTNTEPCEKHQKKTRTQGTQYISSMTTRSTCTSTFIKHQSVGTNFPENVPISIDDILKEMIVDIIPIDPIQDLNDDVPQSIKQPLMITTGTSTDLKNVRNPIDYVSASIKRSNSRPPSRNMCDRIKNESQFTGMPTFSNPFIGLPLPPMQNTVSDLWNILGQTLFTLLHSTNPSVNSNLGNNRVTNLDSSVQREHQGVGSDQSNAEMSFYEEDGRSINFRENSLPTNTRSIATSPTHPVELMRKDDNNSYKGTGYLRSFDTEENFNLMPNNRPSTRTTCTSPLKEIEMNANIIDPPKSMAGKESDCLPTYGIQPNSSNSCVSSLRPINIQDMCKQPGNSGEGDTLVKKPFVKPSAFASITSRLSNANYKQTSLPSQDKEIYSESEVRISGRPSGNHCINEELDTLISSQVSSPDPSNLRTTSSGGKPKSPSINDSAEQFDRSTAMPVGKISTLSLHEFQKVILSPRRQVSNAEQSFPKDIIRKRKRSIKSIKNSKMKQRKLTTEKPDSPKPSVDAVTGIPPNWKEELFGSETESESDPSLSPADVTTENSTSLNDNGNRQDRPLSPCYQNGVDVGPPSPRVKATYGKDTFASVKPKKHITEVLIKNETNNDLPSSWNPTPPRTTPTEMEPLRQSEDPLNLLPVQSNYTRDLSAVSSGGNPSLIASVSDQSTPSPSSEAIFPNVQPLDLFTPKTRVQASRDLSTDDSPDSKGQADFHFALNDSCISSDDSETDSLSIDALDTSPNRDSCSSQESNEELKDLMESSESTFQSFLSNVLKSESAPERPISAITPSESENEQTFTSPPKLLKHIVRKQKSNLTGTSTKASRISLLGISGVQLGKYTTKTNEPSEVTKQVQKYTKRKADEIEKLESLPPANCTAEKHIRLGFFRDFLEESEDLDNRSEVVVAGDCQEIENHESDVAARSFNDELLDEGTSCQHLKTCSVASITTDELRPTIATDLPIYFEDCPASPPPAEQKPEESHEVVTCDDFEQVPNQVPTNLSILSSFLCNYDMKRRRVIVSFQVDQKLVTKVQDVLQEVAFSPVSPDEMSSKIDNILTVTTCNKHISLAFIEILKKVPRAEDEPNYTVPDLFVTPPLRRLIHFCEMFLPRKPDLRESLTTQIDRMLFSFSKEQRELPLEAVMNFTQFYLTLIADRTTPINPARQFIYKSLYCYNQKAIPMVYETLCFFPAVLPKKNSPRYNRSDALVNTIQCVLMNIWFNLEKNDLKTKKILTKLRVFYGYETMKPSRNDIIENLVLKIEANRLKDVALSFALLCKRIDQQIIEAEILKQHLVPLARRYYVTMNETVEHDEKIVCLLECISMIIKPFRLDTDIRLYRSLFRQFLYTCDQQNIQEAAVQAILRTERFGIRSCFSTLYHFRTHYKLSPLTLAMIDTFIYRNRIGSLRAMEKEIRVSHASCD